MAEPKEQELPLKAKEEEIKIPEIPAAVKPPEGYTDQEWGLLNNAEKAAIAETMDYKPDEETATIDPATLAKIAGEEPTEEQKSAAVKAAEDQKKVDDEAAIKAAVDAEAAKKAAEAVPATVVEPAKAEAKGEITVVSDDDLLAYRPVIAAKDIEVIVTPPAEMLKANQVKVAELRSKFDSGDLTREQYEDQRDELKEQIADWKSAERDRLREEKRDEVVWKREQEAFFHARTDYLGERLPDGKFKNTTRSSMLSGALNSAIQQIEKEMPGLQGMQLLIRADRTVRESFNLPIPGEKPAVAKPVISVKPPAKHPDIITLGDLPAAGKNTTEDGWGALDRLPGPKLEEWLSKQPDSVRDAYLNSLHR